MKRGMILTLSVAALALAVTGIAVARNGAKQGGPEPCMNAAMSRGDVTWDKAVLWPPNHKLIPVTFSWVNSDPGQHTLSITGVTSIGSEKGSGQPTSKQDHGADFYPAPTVTGSSADSGDASEVTIGLRAERSGTDKVGRTYKVDLKCHSNSDATGATDGTASAIVWVPHDMGNANGPGSGSDPTLSSAASSQASVRMVSLSH